MSHTHKDCYNKTIIAQMASCNQFLGALMWKSFEDLWPDEYSSYSPILLQFLVQALFFCFPVGITGFVGVTSRDAHRAMFPSPRQENFYSQRERLETSVKPAGIGRCASGYTFKINLTDATLEERHPKMTTVVFK